MILKNAKIISPIDNIDEFLDIKIENGIIMALSKDIEGDAIDLSDMIITPGLIDMHCHLREPGFEYKETIKTGILSAINGGFSVICPMANTNPANDNIETLKYIKEKALQADGIDVLSICAVSKGLQGEELTNIKELKSAGAIAFSDDGRPVENIEILKQALLSGELIISHAEDSKLLTDPISEAVAVERELKVLRKTGGRLHFAHISTKKAIDLIKQAKNVGLSVTCETAPHYFTFTKNDETLNGQFKMNPPLRTQGDLQAVIKGLKDGTIDCIATDHAPHSYEEKTKPFVDSPFGIVGFETALGTGLKLVTDGHLTINKLVEKMSTNPAKILDLKGFGEIKVGQIANLTIIDPNVEYEVKAEEFMTKCKISPFEGMELKGKAIGIVANGKLIKTGEILCKQQ